MSREDRRRDIRRAHLPPMNALRCDRCGNATPFNPDATYPRRCAACGCIVVAASMPWIDLAAGWALAVSGQRGPTRLDAPAR